MKLKYSTPYLYSETVLKSDIFAASGDMSPSPAPEGLDKMANGSNNDNLIMFWGS